MDILNEEGSNLYKKILSGEALQKPSVLNCFLILSFAVSPVLLISFSALQNSFDCRI